VEQTSAYIPITTTYASILALIIMMVIENASGMSIALHIMGIALIIGRILHTTGMNPSNPMTLGRGIGAVLTYAAMAVGALYALKLVLPGI